jgi:RNA polymerase sigma-70 factor (ECF subfamily)
VRRRWFPIEERNNEEWLAALRGPEKEAALGDLRGLLVRGLRAALHGRVGGVEPSVEDFVQEALLKILDNLDSFRGESRFTVWAQKICVRTAFAEMRRSRWRDVSLEDVIDRQGEGAVAPSEPVMDPERATAKSIRLADFRRFMDEDLTEKQRVALLAAIGGMPLEAIADRMGTNRNALYKLLYDARKRLKRRMQAERLSAEDVLGVFA